MHFATEETVSIKQVTELRRYFSGWFVSLNRFVDGADIFLLDG